MSDAVFVVTCRVPDGAPERLRVEIADRTVTASAPGFRRAFEIPPEAAARLLEWQVYAGVLELRAPYVSSVRAPA